MKFTSPWPGSIVHDCLCTTLTNAAPNGKGQAPFGYGRLCKVIAVGRVKQCPCIVVSSNGIRFHASEWKAWALSTFPILPSIDSMPLMLLDNCTFGGFLVYEECHECIVFVEYISHCLFHQHIACVLMGCFECRCFVGCFEKMANTCRVCGSWGHARIM